MAAILTDTDTNERSFSPQPRFTCNTLLIQGKSIQLGQGTRTHWQTAKRGFHNTERVPVFVILKVNSLADPPMEGNPHLTAVEGGQEVRGEELDCTEASYREEQTELSLRDGNRKVPASCISTLRICSQESQRVVIQSVPSQLGSNTNDRALPDPRACQRTARKTPGDPDRSLRNPVEAPGGSTKLYNTGVRHPP